MATESVAATPATTIPVSGNWAYSGNIIMQDMILEFALSNSAVGENTMREYAKMMAQWAKSILVLARARGDDDSDAPGTFENGIAGAEFFLHLSDELLEAAPAMHKGA